MTVVAFLLKSLPGRTMTLSFSGMALLSGFLLCPVKALAAPIVFAFYNEQESFSIHANNLNRMVEAEIRIAYQSEDPNLPLVTNLLQSLRITTGNIKTNAVEVKTNTTPGSIIIQLSSKIPLSGYVRLATARISGTITSLSALLRYENGTTEVPSVTITNPSPEQLTAKGAQRDEANRISAPESAAEVNRPDDTQVPARSPYSAQPADIVLSPADPPAADPLPPLPDGTVVTPSAGGSGKTVTPRPQPPLQPDSASQPATVSASSMATSKSMKDPPQLDSYRRRESLLDRFSAASGERTSSELAGMLLRSEPDFNQQPPLLLSDGISALTLTLSLSGKSALSPKFFITGGHCTNVTIGENGTWALEIVPERGIHSASVMVMAGTDVTQYPLDVAPPLETFNPEAASQNLADFVNAANRLLRRNETPAPAKN